MRGRNGCWINICSCSCRFFREDSGCMEKDKDGASITGSAPGDWDEIVLQKV